jgi:hypothetical protein
LGYELPEDVETPANGSLPLSVPERVGEKQPLVSLDELPDEDGTIKDFEEGRL